MLDVSRAKAVHMFAYTFLLQFELCRADSADLTSGIC